MRSFKLIVAGSLAGFALAFLPGCNDTTESGTQIKPDLEAAKQQKSAMENYYKSNPKTAKGVAGSPAHK